MNRATIAVIFSALAIVVLLGGTYLIFTALAANLAPGRTLGMFSAALMVGSGLACAGVVYAANKWVGRSKDTTG
ncbi:MAG: hypothetical protein EKK46_12810 [Rhodocyclaceae bacterium]|nr:MAG: hypothetical protein EKK46_12810 [Rhodocyclaceae bacterium]